MKGVIMSLTRTKIFSTLLKFAIVVSCGLGLYGIAQAEEHGYRGHEFREHEFRQHAYLDSRYHHNRYYPPHGYAFAALPPAHRVVVYGGAQYFFASGVWYRHVGVNFVVVAPPIGIVVPILPPYYTTLWVGTVPYYYADNVYYTRSPQGYVVVQEPPSKVIVEQQPPSAAVQQPGNVVELGPSNSNAQTAPYTNAQPAPSTNAVPEPEGQLFIYPSKGQSQAQQTKDRNACHSWATSQTGYDPAIQSGNVPADQTSGQVANYQRALGACLEGRGYTVK
jgi:uncharacterized protein DUF6515